MYSQQEFPMQRFMRRPKRLLLGIAVPLFCLAPAESVRAESKLFQDVLHSTGLVEVPHPEGRTTYGACWLVDEEHRLAITGQHLVNGAAEVVVYFPAYRDGTVIPELAHYHRYVAAVHGRVVHGDKHRDLAVLQLDSLPDHVKAMRLAEQSAGPGDTVHSIGNSGVLVGKLWRYTAGKVRSVYQAEIRTDDGLLKARIIETQSPINGGDSGGPLVNDRSELVGVVNSRQKLANLVSFNVDVSEVRAFLAEVRGQTKAPPAAAASGDRQSPLILGSWKVTRITLDGEQLPGRCYFETDGTFTLTAQAGAGSQTRRGRYSYANGVLLMAWDRFQVREALHWVKDRRFTLLSDEMLIFDRQPDVAAAEESALSKSCPSEHRARTNENTNWQRLAPGYQPLANVAGTPSPGGPVHSTRASRPDWRLAILLIGSVGVLLLLDKTLGHRRPTSNTSLAQRASEEPKDSGSPEGAPPARPSKEWEANVGVNDAANHGPR
jgi:hypothetical protein